MKDFFDSIISIVIAAFIGLATSFLFKMTSGETVILFWIIYSITLNKIKDDK